jgi:RNA polymerase sigma factor (sigma-70 family)
MTNSESAERVEHPWNLHALREGDASEVRRFLEYLIPRLSARVHRLGLSWDEVDDVVQSVLIMLLNPDRLAKIDSPHHLMAYADVLARNAALHQMKRTRSIQRLDLRLSAADTFELESDPSLRISLEKALLEIDPEERHIITLRYVEGHSVNEIAESIGLSRMAVRTRLARALDHVRGFLSDPAITGDDNAF